MSTLIKGGNAPVIGQSFDVSVRWKLATKAVEEIDVSVFVLKASRKVGSDRDMIFYGQRHTGDGSVRLSETNRPTSNGFEEALFAFDLSRLAADVEFIAITATIPEARAKKLSFAQVSSLDISVANAGITQASFDVPVAGMTEAALVLGELYRRNGQWKFRAAGQGFNGGLKPLAESFGVEVADDPEPSAPSQPQPPRSSPSVPRVQPHPTPQVAQTTPAAAPISLSKVTLTKAAPSISLAKKASGFGEIRVNLNWNKKQKGGFFGGSRNVDLDLACLFEFKDGHKGVVQALGKVFGDFDNKPYIRLSADDRTGDSADGEWMRVNGRNWNEIKRVLIYTFIYDGVANWAETDGLITVYVPDSPPIEVKLDEGASSKRTCAIALLENDNGGIKVNRVVKYYSDVSKADQDFDWGLRWVAGSK
ncbi:TerD domain-containing protein [Mesorhizobium sp. M1006]|uniref:TerD family protein n=1 Tax=Mesorhizobium sp. M1006 TaxID=2957048 RepID=UPI00333B93A5